MMNEQVLMMIQHPKGMTGYAPLCPTMRNMYVKNIHFLFAPVPLDPLHPIYRVPLDNPLDSP